MLRFILIVTFSAALFAELIVTFSAALFAEQPMLVEVPAPTSKQLNDADTKKMLELQRDQQYRRAEYLQKLKEAADLEKQMDQANRKVDDFLFDLKSRYKCAMCDLLWTMEWQAQPGVLFKQEQKPTPEK